MKRLILAVALAGLGSAGATPPPKQQAQGGAHPAQTHPEAAGLDTVGSATMLEDRTIVLSLVYWSRGGGHTTPARFTYKPDDPKYGEVLRHLGGMKPGESKPVKPWTDTIDPAPDFGGALSPELKEVPWPGTNTTAPTGKTR